MARAVERHGCVEAPRPCLHAEPVHDEVAELPRAPAQALDLPEVGLLLEFEAGSVEEHRRAGSRGDDDRVFAGKCPDRVANDLSRRIPVAAVERGLAAARLRLREPDIAAEV